MSMRDIIEIKTKKLESIIPITGQPLGKMPEIPIKIDKEMLDKTNTITKMFSKVSILFFPLIFTAPFNIPSASFNFINLFNYFFPIFKTFFIAN